MDEGEADLALFDVDPDHPDLDLHARLNDLLGSRDLVIGQLGDVQQTLEVLLELHEDTEVGDLRHVAREQVPDVVVVRDHVQPRVGRELLEAERDALLLRVDREDDALHPIALANDLGRVADLLGPAHVGDVQQAVDALFDLDERAVGGQVADRTLDDGSRGVLLLGEIPGVRLGLLHAERDLLLLLVDLEHDDLDLVARLDELGGVVHPAGPGHLGDVDQTFDAVLELHEGAVGHEVDHLTHVLRVNRVTLVDAVPGAGGLLLETQRDPLAIEVDAQDLDLELLAHLDHLRGVLNAAPGHVGDVEQTVDTAEVHEHAEVGDVLDGTHADLTLGDVLEQGLLHRLTLLLEELPAGDDHVHALRIDLDDPCADRLVDEVGDVVRTAQVDLRRRQEDRDAFDVDQQTTLDLALNDTLDLVALGVALVELLPGTLAIRPALGDVRGVVLVETAVVDLVGLALLGQRLTELGQGQVSLGLSADVHDHLAGTLVHRIHERIDDRVLLEFLDGTRQRFGVGGLIEVAQRVR